MNIHSNDCIVGPERDKYNEIWTKDDYKKISPGFDHVERFMQIMQPLPGASLIDLGCGEGVAGLAFAQRGLNVHYLDHVDAQLKPEVDRHHFIKDVLWGNWGCQRKALGWDYGFCCDVLEHLPPEFTMLAIDRIVKHCRVSWLQIALGNETWGNLIGKQLHLTVQTFTWWRDRIATIANITDARDLYIRGLFIVERK